MAPLQIGSERTIVARYGTRDVLLYALSVGAGVDTPHLVIERPGLVVIPTWGAVVAMQAVRAVVQELADQAEVVIHDTMALSCVRPWPPQALTETTARLEAVYDLKRLLRADVHARTLIDGELVGESRWGLLFRGARVDGAPRPPPRPRGSLPERPPDWVHAEATRADQALLYRLNGDDNPIHVDPEAAARAGLPGTILHGLCLFGIVGRVCLEQLCAGDPSRWESLEGRFSRPVRPGASLVLRAWRGDDRTRVAVADSEGTEVFAEGWARVRGAPSPT
jgi:acyl dehydratase